MINNVMLADNKIIKRSTIKLNETTQKQVKPTLIEKSLEEIYRMRNEFLYQNKPKSKSSLKYRVHKIMNKLKQLSITPIEFCKGKIFPTEAYEYQYSREFILAAKNGDMIMVQKILAKIKYIVYSFDYTS